MRTNLFQVLFILLLIPGFLKAEKVHKEKEEAFNPGEMIAHHITDSHEWHFATIGEYSIVLPLPIILYSPEKGLSVFSSSNFEENPAHVYEGYKLIHDHIVPVDAGITVYDFSITKNVTQIIVICLILLGVFLSVAAGYKKNQGKAPSGIQSFFEPIIIYIRDDVAKPNIGKKYERYMPYLLTIFFFVWFNNVSGLIPGAANITGNVAITGVLALFTFLITNFSGNKYYWGHVFWTPGVPLPLKFIIVPIEMIGLFIKPFSLTVRLFANMLAGHIIILSFLGLIFMFESLGVATVSIPFALFMGFLELFVALLQAYIFTLLSAMYIAAAVGEHAHDEHHVDPALY